MNQTCYNLSGWLTASGSYLSGIAPSGTLCFRTVNLATASVYGTGYVSMFGGSFKRIGESGNWYADSPQTRDAEAPASGTNVYELWELMRDTPVLDAHGLPSEYLSEIALDGGLKDPDRYAKSWLFLNLLDITNPAFDYSGVCFPSRRISGSVFVLNPAAVPMGLFYTGKFPPSGVSPHN
jgi:hypothetical protein